MTHDFVTGLPQETSPQPQPAQLPISPHPEPHGLVWQLNQIHFAWNHPDLAQGWWLVSITYGLLVCILTLLVLDTVREFRSFLRAESVVEKSTHE